MKCINCLYYYKVEDDMFPECQWYSRAPGDCAPCEEEDYIEEDEDE